MRTRATPRNAPLIFPPWSWATAAGILLAGASIPALAQGADAPPAGFKRCATEGEKCSFGGTAKVVYSAGSTWTSPRIFTNGVACTTVRIRRV